MIVFLRLIDIHVRVLMYEIRELTPPNMSVFQVTHNPYVSIWQRKISSSQQASQTSSCRFCHRIRLCQIAYLHVSMTCRDTTLLPPTTVVCLQVVRPYGAISSMFPVNVLEPKRIGQMLIDSDPALRWRHNGHDSVSNHQLRDCLLNCLFWRRSKKTSKLRVTGLCAVSGEFPAQMASNAENVSIWWRHHGLTPG